VVGGAGDEREIGGCGVVAHAIAGQRDGRKKLRPGGCGRYRRAVPDLYYVAAGTSHLCRPAAVIRGS
jgi:hypothetical protein